DGRGPNGGEVRQRTDAEIPRRYHGPPPPDAEQRPAPPRGPRPVTSVSGSPIRPPAPPPAPPRPATPSQVEELIRRSHDNVDFFELVDDIIDEMARRIGQEDPNVVSPLAIRLVRLSANMRPEFAHTLESRLVARLINATQVKVVVCAECEALRSSVEDGNWVLKLGAVNQDDLRRLGEKVGIKTFMDVDFTYSPDQQVIWMEASVFRASDGGVVWSDAYRSDGTMAALLRTGRRIPTRAERAAELEQKINGRPNYGYGISLGVAQMGYTAPTGDIVGAQASLRFHEKFGEDQSSLFGLSAGIFTTGLPSNGQAINSILLGAYGSHDLSAPNLNKPELWVYGEAGGMFTGNQGNTFYFESGLDVHLKFRLSLMLGLMYVVPTTYANYDLGGLGYRLRVAINW
ncbi:MAG TPA: hypothetical protein VHO06_21625, partial [Polyangia bacterium]|nr:hypothetical protein [Polyangia bacterium]